MLRGRLLLATAMLLALAVTGHSWFWYWPRERAARLPSRPVAESAAGLLFAAESTSELEIAIWLPFPHQNLAAWSGGDRRWLQTAVADLGEGRWPLLPARDLALRWSLARGRGALAARSSVYPLVSWLARMTGPEVPGGTDRVAWQGTRLSWQPGGVSDRPLAGKGGTLALEDAQPVLLALRLSRPMPPLAAGLYGVRRGSDGLELRDLERFPATPPSPLSGHGHLSVVDGEVCLVALTRSVASDGWELLALLGPRANRQEVVASGGLQIPSAVVMRTSTAGGFELPTASLMKRLDLDPRPVEIGPWQGLASDRRAAAVAAALAGAMSALVSGDGSTLEAALWLEPRPLAQLAEDLLTVLDGSPLAPSAELSRWGALPLLGELLRVDRVAFLYARGRGRLFLDSASD